MRILEVASSAVAIALLLGCAAETTSPQRTIRRNPSSASPPVGEDNDNGEHGTNAPAGPGTAPAPGTAVGSETWADGKKIDASVSISEGATVEIAPGATITIAANAAITVQGTLKIASTAKHVTLAGTGWEGLIVAKGGTLLADGLDIDGPKAALWTQTGNVGAKVSNATIKATSPFKMEAGSKLELVKVNVTAGGGSAIAGDFIASRMTYDKGTNGGLTINDPAATVTISDSVLKGAGGGDYLISSAARSIEVGYTTISGSHCGIHFTAVDRYTLDHVSDDQNAYGAMLYGSGAGPHSIVSSNIRNTDKDLDMTGTNGPLAITKSFTGGKNTLAANATNVNPAAAAIPEAKPRAE